MRYLIVFIVLLFGCNEDRLETIIPLNINYCGIDNDVLYKAVDFWHTNTRPDLFMINQYYGSDVVILPSNDPMVPGITNIKGSGNDIYVCIVYIDVNANNDNQILALAHELGHTLGLMDRTDGSVMNDYIGNVTLSVNPDDKRWIFKLLKY